MIYKYNEKKELATVKVSDFDSLSDLDQKIAKSYMTVLNRIIRNRLNYNEYPEFLYKELKALVENYLSKLVPMQKNVIADHYGLYDGKRKSWQLVGIRLNLTTEKVMSFERIGMSNLYFDTKEFIKLIHIQNDTSESYTKKKYSSERVWELTELPQRVINALMRNDIKTIDQLQTYSTKDLLGMPGFGKVNIEVLVSVLSKNAISLSEN